MQQININELKPHPRNNEFFDDISGENWDAFLDSVKSSGVIEPVIITGDKYIISGHQRVRACRELGIESVYVKVNPCYLNDDYDTVLKALIETNIRQRGIGNTNQRKMGLCIKELERIYGIRNGSFNSKGDNRIGESNNFTDQLPKNETELLKSLGLNLTRQTLQNYKQLTEMIPELEELVTTGIVTNTTALAIMRNLSSDEQEKLICSLDTTKRITQKQMKKYIDEITYLREHSEKPSDYESTKKALLDYKNDYSRLESQFKDKVSELQELRKQIEKMKVTEPTEQYNKKLKDSTIFFCSKVAEFIEKAGGYVWLSDHINELPEYERKSYIHAAQTVNDWSNTLLNNINNN